MLPIARRNRRASLCLAVLCALGLSLPGAAQDGPAAQPEQAADGPTPPQTEEQAPEALSIELDLSRLLFDQQSSNFNDQVWQLDASTGRQYFYLPLIVGPVEETTELSRCPIAVGRGRFIGYVVPGDGSGLSSAPHELDLAGMVSADAQELEAMLFQSAQDFVDDPFGLEEEPDADEEADAPDTDYPEVPEFAPRLARELIFHPDGSVQWEMGRVFFGGTAAQGSEQNPYPFLIDREQLAALEPERPEPITRNAGEDSRAGPALGTSGQR